jgi:gas vesicle protein
MREEGGYSSGSMFLSFLLGGIVGAAVALLLAPESGRDTRHKIKEFTGDMKDKVRDYAGDVKGRVSTTIEKGKDLYEEKKSTITKAVEAGREAYDKEKERLSKEPNA